jgi:hypothetical protein
LIFFPILEYNYERLIYPGDPMILERISGTIYLKITEDFRISFSEEWIKHLRSLPYERFGEFLRGTIYKVLSPQERKLWNKTRISNTELLRALKEFE